MFSDFLRANARWLGAGMTLTLASSFGQTYFISIFADRIMEDYGLTDGQWGLVYTVATLSSAAVLLFAGRFAYNFLNMEQNGERVVKKVMVK